MKRSLIIAGVIVIVTAGAVWWMFGRTTEPAQFRPAFDDYPVEGIYSGVPAAVDFTSNPEASAFRTRITQGAAVGPNFAGHFTVIGWGCGTECQNHAIVDAVTGDIVQFGMTTESGVSYRLDSTLFVMNIETQPEYYQMVGTNLIRLAQGAL
jgi:hypothetical protein